MVINRLSSAASCPKNIERDWGITGAKQAARLPLQRLATDELLRRFGGDLDVPDGIES